MLCSLRLYFLLSLLILSQPAFAQFPSLHFENISTANGLSNNEVTCFYQDHGGFLWVGTRFGLNRFDGKNFQTFYHNADDTNSISGNNIADVLQDRDGIFWIATKDGGLTRYDPSAPKEKQFHQFTNRPGDATSIPTNRLNCLFDYSSDYLLAGAEIFPGIFIDKKTFAIKTWGYSPSAILAQSQLFSPAAQISNSRAGSWIHKIRSRNDTLFIGFLTAAGVKKVVNDTLRWEGEFFDESVKPQTPSDFCLDGNKIWQANWTNGLFLQTTFITDKPYAVPLTDITIPANQPATRLERFSDISDVVTHVDLFNADLLIAGTSSSGLYLVNKKTAKEISYTHDSGDPYSLASNSVTALFKDRRGTWWIGTKNGISKYNPVRWQFNATPLPVLSSHDLTIFSAYEDEQGALRICTSDGVYKKEKSEQNFRLLKFSAGGKAIQPTLIYRYDSNRYFMGTELAFYDYNPQQETISEVPLKGEKKFHPANKMYNYFTFQIRSMVKDTFQNQPVLWYAPLGWGLGLYEMNRQANYDFLHTDSLPNSIRNNLSRKVMLDKSHQLWVATSEGLYRWRRNESLKNDFDFFLHHPGDSTSISNNDVTDLFVDEENNLWLTTNGGGINEYDGKRFYNYQTAFTASNSMYGIYPDGRGRFWIPSARGFEVFDRKKKTFLHVDLPAEQWNLRLPTRLLRLQDGSFVYGALNNCISFRPDDYVFDDSFPKVYLSGIQLFNKPFEFNGKNEVSFAYNKNYLAFNFSSLQLSAPGTVRYRYRLTGFDKTWSESTEEGKANYTNLPPGYYTFEVTVTNPLGEWGDAHQLFAFTIQSPFWKCWWFYLMCVVAVALAIYLITLARIRNFMKIQGIRNRIANDLHDEVGSALSTISLYSQVAKLKTGEQQELGNVLDKITNTSQEMQENMSYIVWSIQPRNDRFDQMVQRMKRYAIEILQAKNMEVKFVFDDHMSSVKLSQEKRKELFLIFKEAINNITKYANSRSVNIFFRKNKGRLEMEITDDGIGFRNEDVVSGNGLHSMRDRATALGGSLNITSAPQRGTTVVLSFPA